MRCEHARQLFDAYLDGELSPSQTTELAAHRVRCGECRRELALLEVAGHLVSSDRESVQLPAGFTDRLLACMDESKTNWKTKWARRLYIAGPLAAAAVIALAFLGVFDSRGTSHVAGRKDVRQVPIEEELLLDVDAPIDSAGSANANGDSLSPLLKGVRQNMHVLGRGKELIDKLPGTILGGLEGLQQAGQDDADAPARIEDAGEETESLDDDSSDPDAAQDNE